MSSIFKNRKIKILSILAVVILALLGSFIIFKNQGEETKAADWFNENWYYRKTIPISYSGNSVLTEYQVFLDNFDTASLISAGKMQADCDDIRFTNKNGKLLDYYIVTNTCNTADTEIWIKTDKISPGGVTLYMYYGNSKAKKFQSERKTFTYSEEKVVGYVLNTGTTAYDLISLEDGNSITHNGTTLDLDKGETSAITTSAYLPVSAKKLFNMSTEEYDTIVPVGWAGTEFVYRNRSSNYSTYFVMISPWGTATVKIYINGTQCGTDRTVTSSGLRVTDCGGGGYDVYRIVSDIPILVNKSSTTADPFPLHPAGKGPWYGWDSTQDNFAAGPNGASYQWIDSGMTTVSSGSLGADSGAAIGAGGGSYYSGDTVKIWTTDYGIGVASHADSDGGDGTTYMPRYEFGTITGSPYATDYVSVLSDQPATCTTYTASGHSIDTVTLSSSNTQIYELGGTSFGIGNSSEYIGGAWYVECDKPAMFVSQYIDDEQNMWTYPMMRQFTYPTPSVGGFGSEQNGPSPVAYWDFNEGYGSTVYDKSSNGNNGTITGATWKSESECLIGKCLYFDGDGDYVQVPNSSSLQVDRDGTWEAWVKTDLNFSRGGLIFKHYNNEYELIIESSGLVSVYHGDGSWEEMQEPSVAKIVKNKWTHIAVTRNHDTKTYTWYINGQEVGTDTYVDTPLASTNDLFIGYRNGTSSYFKGFIDEVKIYNYTRTADQIKQDYNQGKSLVFGSDEYASLNNGLVGWWKMDESSYSSGSVQDSSGLGNVMSAIGSVVSSSTAKFGRAADFAADNDYLCTDKDGNNSCDYTDNIDYGKNNFTISFWIKADSSATQRIASHYGGGGGYVIQKDIDSINFYINDGTTALGYKPVVTGVTPHDGNWHLATLVVDRKRKEVRGYWDGEYKNKMDISTITGAISPTAAYVLGYYGGFADDYTGLFDDWRVYNRALSPEEVRRLYEWAPGPKAHFNLDEYSGNSVLDSSGNNNSATLYNSPGLVNGKFGRALEFNGVDQYVSFQTGFNSPANWTYSFWFYPKDTGSTAEGLVGNVNQPRVTWETGGRVQFGLGYASGGWAGGITSDYLPIKQWHYVAAVMKNADTDSPHAELYIDGILSGIKTWTAPIRRPDDVHYISRRDSYSTFSGYIDDVKIYNYARSPRQILEDMHAGRKNNPTGYWDFNEGQGVTVHDHSGKGNDGTLKNMSTSGTSTVWTKHGKAGGALKFDGVNDYVMFTNSNNEILPSNNEAFSISLWFNANDLDTTSIKSIMSNETYQTSGFRFGTGVNHKLHFWSTESGGGINMVSDVSVEAGKWYLATIVYTGSSAKMYINGKLVAKDDSGIVISNTNNIYLARNIGGKESWQGYIDEVKIYNYPLTLDEIRQNYNQGKQIVLSKSEEEVRQASEGLVGWWKMDESSWSGNSGEVIDYSGTGNSGTSYNGANTTSTAKYGRAGEFDGVDDYIPINIDLPQSFTIQAWANPKEPDDNYGTIFADYGGADGFFMRYQKTTGAMRSEWWKDGIRYFSTYTTASFSDGWTLWTVVYNYNSKNAKIYKNGVLTNEAKDVLVGDSSNNFNIGGNYGGVSESFKGEIDDVKYYNYARSPEQIMHDYAEGPPPIAHWKFDEMEGSTAADSSGMGNDGTITGATWEVRGKKGSALKFDGSGDYVDAGNLGDLKNNFSFALWLNPDRGNSATFPIAYQNGGDSTSLAFRIEYGQVGSDIMQFGMYVNGATTELTASTALIPGTWNYVVGTYDGSTMKLYINGSLDSSKSQTGIPAYANNKLVLGARYIGSYSQEWVGKIDEVKIYNYALSPRQVAMEYNNGQPIAYWKFDKGEGGTAYDYSGSGNNGIIYPGTSGTNTSTSTMWSNGSDGKVNGSLDFDGTDDYVDINSSISFPDNLTIGGWFKTSASGVNQTIFFANSASGADRIQVRVHNTNVLNVLTDNSASWPSYDIMGKKIVTDGNWHHFTFVQRGTSLSLYIDDELDATEEISANSAFTSTNNKISYYISGNSQVFNGQIDEIKIWNYALTPEEIKKESNAGFGIRFK